MHLGSGDPWDQGVRVSRCFASRDPGAPPSAEFDERQWKPQLSRPQHSKETSFKGNTCA